MRNDACGAAGTSPVAHTGIMRQCSPRTHARAPRTPPTHTHSGCFCNDTISSTIKMRQILKPQESVKLSLVTPMSRIMSNITIKSWLYINLIIVKYEGEFACHPGLENWWWGLCVMYQCLFYTSCDPVTGSLNRLSVHVYLMISVFLTPSVFPNSYANTALMLDVVWNRRSGS